MNEKFDPAFIKPADTASAEDLKEGFVIKPEAGQKTKINSAFVKPKFGEINEEGEGEKSGFVIKP